MKYLLDTNTFIWWNKNSDNLSPVARSIVQERSHTLLLSLVSVWEIQIKVGLGKLTLPASLAEILQKQRDANQIELLSITLPHILALENLPPHHKDPFDRLLVAQVQIEQIPILSADPMLKQYGIPVIW